MNSRISDLYIFFSKCGKCLDDKICWCTCTFITDFEKKCFHLVPKLTHFKFFFIRVSWFGLKFNALRKNLKLLSEGQWCNLFCFFTEGSQGKILAKFDLNFLKLFLYIFMVLALKSIKFSWILTSSVKQDLQIMFQTYSMLKVCVHKKM